MSIEVAYNKIVDRLLKKAKETSIDHIVYTLHTQYGNNDVDILIRDIKNKQQQFGGGKRKRAEGLQDADPQNWWANCKEPTDPIFLTEWDDPNTDYVKIYDQGMNQPLCFERPSLLRTLRDSTFANWIQHPNARPMNDVGTGGMPGDERYHKMLRGDFITHDSYELLFDPTIIEFDRVFVEGNKRIGNLAGTPGMGQLHGQLPGYSVYRLEPRTRTNDPKHPRVVLDPEVEEEDDEDEFDIVEPDNMEEIEHMNVLEQVGYDIDILISNEIIESQDPISVDVINGVLNAEENRYSNMLVQNPYGVPVPAMRVDGMITYPPIIKYFIDESNESEMNTPLFLYTIMKDSIDRDEHEQHINELMVEYNENRNEAITRYYNIKYDGMNEWFLQNTSISIIQYYTIKQSILNLMNIIDDEYVYNKLNGLKNDIEEGGGIYVLHELINHEVFENLAYNLVDHINKQFLLRNVKLFLNNVKTSIETIENDDEYNKLKTQNYVQQNINKINKFILTDIINYIIFEYRANIRYKTNELISLNAHRARHEGDFSVRRLAQNIIDMEQRGYERMLRIQNVINISPTLTVVPLPERLQEFENRVVDNTFDDYTKLYGLIVRSTRSVLNNNDYDLPEEKRIILFNIHTLLNNQVVHNTDGNIFNRRIVVNAKNYVRDKLKELMINEINRYAERVESPDDDLSTYESDEDMSE